MKTMNNTDQIPTDTLELARFIGRLKVQLADEHAARLAEAQANSQLAADLAARDALIGEIRTVIQEESDWAVGINSVRANRLRDVLKRTPADAGAEIARLRTCEDAWLAVSAALNDRFPDAWNATTDAKCGTDHAVAIVSYVASKIVELSRDRHELEQSLKGASATSKTIIDRAYAEIDELRETIRLAAGRLSYSTLLERAERAEAIIKATLAALPVGSIREHTPESIPERVAHYVREMTKESAESDRLNDAIHAPGGYIELLAKETQRRLAAEHASEVAEAPDTTSCPRRVSGGECVTRPWSQGKCAYCGNIPGTSKPDSITQPEKPITTE